MMRETISKLETNLDHLSGEELGAALTALNDMAEVLDASYFAGLGKKNRPCGKLEVLCHVEDEEKVAIAVFRHTHTLGLRIERLERLVLQRHSEIINLEKESIRAKGYELEGRKYSRPEADELIKLSHKKSLGMPAMRFEKKRD